MYNYMVGAPAGPVSGRLTQGPSGSFLTWSLNLLTSLLLLLMTDGTNTINIIEVPTDIYYYYYLLVITAFTITVSTWKEITNDVNEGEIQLVPITVAFFWTILFSPVAVVNGKRLVILLITDCPRPTQESPCTGLEVWNMLGRGAA